MLNVNPETVKKVSQVSFEQQSRDTHLPKDLNSAFISFYSHEHLWELQREMWRQIEYLNTFYKSEDEFSHESDTELNSANERLSQIQKAVDEEEKRLEDKKQDFIDYLKSLK
jgi:hypothetical protein